jgi:hypothetical protein
MEDIIIYYNYYKPKYVISSYLKLCEKNFEEVRRVVSLTRTIRSARQEYALDR